MSCYTRCPECSFCIGKYVRFIDKAKQALYEETIFAKDSDFRDYDPEKMSFNSDIAIPLEGIFTALDIKNRCCRMHLVSKTDFDKIYK